MITVNENAVQVNDSNVQIGEWFQMDDNDESTKRFTGNAIMIERDEAIAIAKAILASVEVEETIDDWADERAAQLEDFAALADDMRF